MAKGKLLLAKMTSPRCAEFYVGGSIGEDTNCHYIASDILYLNNNDLVDRINIHINSEGGNVVNGVALIGQILNSDLPIYTYNDGYAMSMAGYIWMAAKKENRCMAEFGVLMLHAARFLDDEGQPITPSDPDEAKFLDVINNQLSLIISSCTNKSKAEVNKILSKDTFYTADECVKAGFCNSENIKRFTEKPNIDITSSVSENIKRIAAFYNNQNETKIMKNLLVKLGLREEASEISAIGAVDDIFAANARMKNDIQAITADRDALKVRVGELEASLKVEQDKVKKHETEKAEAEKASIEQFVDQAIAKGTFKAEKKAELIAQATKDFAGFKLTVESIQATKAPNIVAQLSVERTPAAERFGLKPEQLNIEYLEKHAFAKLEEIKKADPALYAAMEEEYIAKYSD